MTALTIPSWTISAISWLRISLRLFAMATLLIVCVLPALIWRIFGQVGRAYFCAALLGFRARG